MTKSVAVAAIAPLVATVAGTLAGAAGWDRPKQLLEPPYVESVPVGLLLALLTTAVLSLAAAAVLHRRLLERGPLLNTCLLAVTALAGTAIAIWGALYATAIENAIPVFDWAYFTVPVALACLLARISPPRDRALVTGLLVTAPIAAVHALGWTVYGTWRTGLLSTVVLGGFGTLLGLAASGLPREESSSGTG